MTSGWNSRSFPIERRRSAGFTLLEVTVVMAIIILMLSVTAFAYRSFDNEPSFKKSGDELIRLSKLAVRASAVQGRGFWIVFNEEGFVLRGMEDDQGVQQSHAVPEGIRLKLRRWGQPQWQEAEGQRWVFGVQGLCEPLRVRFEAEDGYLELRFNPLTGSAAEQLMEIY